MAGSKHSYPVRYDIQMKREKNKDVVTLLALRGHVTPKKLPDNSKLVLTKPDSANRYVERPEMTFH